MERGEEELDFNQITQYAMPFFPCSYFSPSHLHIPHTLTPTFRYGYFFISVKWKWYVLYLSVILPAVSLVECGRVGGVTGGEGGEGGGEDVHAAHLD